MNYHHDTGTIRFQTIRPKHEDVEICAYYLWLNSGKLERISTPLDDWLLAEETLTVKVRVNKIGE